MHYATKTKRRVNIMLPADTLQKLDATIEAGERSRLIDQAVRWYLHELGRARLRRQLKAGAVARGQRDRALAREWFAVESAL